MSCTFHRSDYLITFVRMFETLKNLCDIHSPSGEEIYMKEYLLKYINDHVHYWKVKPEIFHGDDFQDCIVLKFGDPKVSAVAHMDTTGFTVRYQNQLIPIGSPDVNEEDYLVGQDNLGLIECSLKIDGDHRVTYDFPRPIKTGTSLTYRKEYVEDEEYIYSPYLDNRAGIFNLLKVAETLENGILIFSCWEEHGGGSMPYLIKYIYEKFNVEQVLISDITWVTDGVHFGEGVVVSMRDRNIPRRSFIDRILDIATLSGINYQVEVEASGSSDGREVQLSPYPIDWCFIGAPEENAHSSQEKLFKRDLLSMISLYKELFLQL